MGRRWWRQRIWEKLMQEELGMVGRHGEFHTSLSHAQPWVPCKSTGSITAFRCRLLWRAVRMLATEGTAWCSRGPVTFCIWLQHRWEAPLKVPGASCLIGPFIRQLPEMERWRQMGGCAPLQASHPATMKQNRSLGGCSLVPNVPPNGITLCSVSGSECEEWRSILSRIFCVSSHVKKLGHPDSQGGRVFTLFLFSFCLAWRQPVERIAW